MQKTGNKIFCVILGGGGHARVVIDCLKASGQADPYAVLDRNQALWGKEIFGVPIRGGDELLAELKKEGVTHFIPAVGGVKDNAPRRKMFEWGIEQGLTPLTLCHSSAILSPYSKIGEGTVIFAGAIVNPAAVIGRNCVINTGVIIEHDCIIEDHVHVAPGSTLSGGVIVRQMAHIGTGSSIRHAITVGEGAVVGAGSVVVKDVPAGLTVKGVPAK